ncbi:MAG: DNA-3-methyladenine glycosylase I [Solirubrobacterales bacterium]
MVAHEGGRGRRSERANRPQVGPTTAYSTMQAAGLVNDHLDGCEFRQPGSSANRRSRKRRSASERMSFSARS